MTVTLDVAGLAALVTSLKAGVLDVTLSRCQLQLGRLRWRYSDGPQQNTSWTSARGNECIAIHALALALELSSVLERRWFACPLHGAAVESEMVS